MTASSTQLLSYLTYLLSPGVEHKKSFISLLLYKPVNNCMKIKDPEPFMFNLTKIEAPKQVSFSIQLP